MNIALDYDDTFTADPDLWADFVNSAKGRGHKIYCVTARRNTPENIAEITGQFIEYMIDIPIIFANLKSKLKTVEDRNIHIDIWIDDAPFSLVNGY